MAVEVPPRSASPSVAARAGRSSVIARSRAARDASDSRSSSSSLSSPRSRRRPASSSLVRRRDLAGRSRLELRPQRVALARQPIALGLETLARVLRPAQLAPRRGDGRLQLEQPVLHGVHALERPLARPRRAADLALHGLRRALGLDLLGVVGALRRRGVLLGLGACVGVVELRHDRLHRVGGVRRALRRARGKERPGEVAQRIARREHQRAHGGGAALGLDGREEGRLAEVLQQGLVDRARDLDVAVVVVDQAPRQVPHRHRLEPCPGRRRAEPADQLAQRFRRHRDDEKGGALIGIQRDEQGHGERL